jgi:hypothetical protein
MSIENYIKIEIILEIGVRGEEQGEKKGMANEINKKEKTYKKK